MNTDQEQTDSPPTEAPVSGVVEPPALRLRALLAAPYPKDEAWQKEAGRAFSLLAVGFLNETDEVSALRAVALMNLCQSAGVKEARKRSIRLSRWMEVPPPPLCELSTLDEQRAAITALSKVAAAWCRDYAEQCLADPCLPEGLLPDLLKWVRALHDDAAAFVRGPVAHLLSKAPAPRRAAGILKQVAKLLKPERPAAASQLAQLFAALVRAVPDSAPASPDYRKAMSTCVATLLALGQEQVDASPPVLLQPAFVLALPPLSRLAAAAGSSRQFEAATRPWCLATVSMLMDDVDRNGAEAATRWRPMAQAWAGAYSRWKHDLESAAMAAPLIRGLVSEGRVEDAFEPTGRYAAEAVFARLLPAWYAFLEELPDADRASSLGSMITEAAGTAGVEALGAKGDVLPYDPLAHTLAEESESAPVDVRVARPGVAVRRADGSTRVLVPALVTAI